MKNIINVLAPSLIKGRNLLFLLTLFVFSACQEDYVWILSPEAPTPEGITNFEFEISDINGDPSFIFNPFLNNGKVDLYSIVLDVNSPATGSLMQIREMNGGTGRVVFRIIPRVNGSNSSFGSFSVNQETREISFQMTHQSNTYKGRMAITTVQQINRTLYLASTVYADSFDTDGDGIPDTSDNCPQLANADQADSDGDGVGDACDNCSAVANTDQADANNNSVGDLCENTTPATPGAISGTSTICSGTLNTYSIATVVGATSYTWTLPGGWTGTSNTISIDATASATSGDILVTANNTSGSSAAQTLAITVNSIPAQPGTISGNATICSGNLNTYSIASVAGATDYTWTLPGGWTGTSTTNSIDATASATSGDITVTANNTCGSSTAQTLAIDVNSIPAQPGTINGNATICSGSLNTYSITAVAGATSYTWILPGGWTGTSTSNFIDATASATSGDISVTANNSCGSSAAQTLAITVNSIPAQPGTISGTSIVCSGGLDTYSITAVAGATSYTWTLPGGWTGTSTTNSIDATASATSGDISVTANNTCGSSTAQTLAIGVNSIPAQPETISGTSTICSGSLNTYTITTVAGATSYTWTMPAGWMGTSATNSIDATASATSGDVSVTANNTCGSSTAQTLTITVNSIPAQPGTISGNATVCSGSSNTYSTLAVAGATTYTWSMPNGWTAISTTNSINATTNGTSGNVSVTANNGCGISVARTLAVVSVSVVQPVITINASNPASPILTSSNDNGNQWFLNGTAIPGAIAKTHTVSAGGSYQVQTTISNCVSPLSVAKVFLVTGDVTKKAIAERATIYPNPVESELVIRLDGFDPNRYVNISLIDGMGRRVTEVMEPGEKEISMEVGHYASGVYFIQMIQGNEAQQLRFIKK